MIWIQRKIKCKFIGDERWLPENVERGKWMPVIGIKTVTKIIEKRGSRKQVEDMNYMVIGNDSKIAYIASFNCATMIDEKGEK